MSGVRVPSSPKSFRSGRGGLHALARVLGRCSREHHGGVRLGRGGAQTFGPAAGGEPRAPAATTFTVQILGEVMKPGTYALADGARLSDALAAAGRSHVDAANARIGIAADAPGCTAGGADLHRVFSHARSRDVPVELVRDRHRSRTRTQRYTLRSAAARERPNLRPRMPFEPIHLDAAAGPARVHLIRREPAGVGPLRNDPTRRQRDRFAGDRALSRRSPTGPRPARPECTSVEPGD
jgi:hypothetical protein